MTLQETGAIMDILETAYPRFYIGVTEAQSKKTAALWCSMFQDEPVKIVAAAVKALIVLDKTGFPPVIGQIKEKIRMMKKTEEMTEGEAWNLVSNALRNGLYGSKEEFEKLPQDVQQIVGSSNQLREWARMDMNTVQSVVASNFQRAYRKRSEQHAEFAALPSDIRQIVGSLPKRFALEDGGDQMKKVERNDEKQP